MTYRVARNGVIFGPYSEAEVREYVASGNIGMFDLIRAESGSDWVPVPVLFPPIATPGPTAVPGAQPRVLYPDPPNFPWWGALLLGIATSGLFLVVWDIVEASWLKRIERSTSALLLYIGVAALYLFKLPSILSTMDYNLGGAVTHGHGLGASSLSIILSIVARFVFRRELLHHFNDREGLGIELNWFWTLLFGGLYFQFRFNKINEYKRASNRSVPAV